MTHNSNGVCSLVCLLKPADRAVAHVIGSSNVGKHLTGLPTSDGFFPLMSSELGFAPQSHAPGDGSRPTLSCS